MKNIVLFGGTFNPIHNGHILCAQKSVEFLKADRLIFIPTNIPPHKNIQSGFADSNHRINMCKLAIRGFSKFEISDFEIKRNKISYTIFTLEYFKSKFFNEQLFLLIGEDMFASFDKWKDYKKIFSLANICVAYRNVESIYNKLSTLEEFRNQGAKISFIENPIINISSTQIRNKINNNEDVSGLIDDNVLKYIKQHGLYL